jgi:hypothetical protein
MTDNMAAGEGMSGEVKAAFSGDRLIFTAVGLIAGVVGFVGFFLNFFAGSNNSLASASSAWYDMVPIFIGLSTLGLLVPRLGLVFSGFAMGGLGIALGIRGTIDQVTQALRQPGPGYDIGFWMITIGAGVLTLAWIAILARDRQRA